MKKNIGLDFGTSNSALGYFENNINLVNFNGKNHTPSTIFYNNEEGIVSFGDQAIEDYIEGHEGRIIWSPKNILGTELMDDKTIIFNKRVSFKSIIKDIIDNLMLSYKDEFNTNIENVVCGRPIFFNDNDADKDKFAENLLQDVIRDCGISNVEFEYEPIAAAISYEQQITREKIALVIDMGGGTSDFTVIKLQPYNPDRTGNRENDILSVGGIHIAGTDFDQKLSYLSVMPELGLGSTYTSVFKKILPIPPTIYRNLTTWHKINFAYTNESVSFIEDKLLSANDKPKIERLLDVIESRYGHALSKLVENCKISLSSNAMSILTTNGLLEDFSINITKTTFEEAIYEEATKIEKKVYNTIIDSGLRTEDIDVVFLTGGSSQIPLIKNKLLGLTPHAEIIYGDTFGSVATGLSILSHDNYK